MTKSEFLAQFSKELNKRGVEEAADIVEEYAQHFAFKAADGHSEEEIAAKLGNPVQLAAQFGRPSEQKNGGRKAAVSVGLAFIDLFAGIGFVFMLAFLCVLAAAAAAFAAVGICLIIGNDMFSLIPSMPTAIALLLGTCLIVLCVLSVCGTIWYVCFLRQILRAFGRFQHNLLAFGGGRPTLPSIPMQPRLDARKARCLKRTARISIIIFAVIFIAAVVMSVILAGKIEFWHKWGWFIGR